LNGSTDSDAIWQVHYLCMWSTDRGGMRARR